MSEQIPEQFRGIFFAGNKKAVFKIIYNEDSPY